MRIRTVKPEFWTHEQLGSCDDFCRLLALALLNYADDEGYFLANPAIIRGAVFPFMDDHTKIRGSLDELVKVGYLEIGVANDGRNIGRIINFRKHQKIDRPQSSKIKDSVTFDEGSSNIRRIVGEPSTTDRRWNGRGEEQEERKSEEPVVEPQAAATPGQDLELKNFEDAPKPRRDKARAPFETVSEFALSQGLTHNDAEYIFQGWESKGWKNIKDWRATIRSWKAGGFFPSQKAQVLARRHPPPPHQSPAPKADYGKGWDIGAVARNEAPYVRKPLTPEQLAAVDAADDAIPFGKTEP